MAGTTFQEAIVLSSTIHSCRRRFAARLNSGVRQHNRQAERASNATSSDKRNMKCPDDQADRIRRAIGKAFPPEEVLPRITDLSAEQLNDLEKVYRAWGSIAAAYFLGSSTSAGLVEIKLFLNEKGWHQSAD